MMLEFKLRDPVQLPFEVLEQAHWRPSEVQLCCKYKPETVGPEFRRLREFWRQKEVFVNFALDSLLLTLRPGELAALASSISNLRFIKARLYGGYSMPLKKIIGVPDFILADDESCILGEIKITAAYDYQQFLKYQTFAALSRLLGSLPDRYEHVIVVQDSRETAFIKDYNKNWSPAFKKSEIVLEAPQRMKLAEHVRRNISILGAKGNCSVEFDSITQSWSDDDFVTRTSVLTWTEFTTHLVESTGRNDIEAFASSIEQLGMGVIKIDQDC